MDIKYCSHNNYFKNVFLKKRLNEAAALSNLLILNNDNLIVQKILDKDKD